VEGIPAGLPLESDQIATDLVRRQRGYGRGARSTSIEQDRADILSGVRHGLTIGSPILLLGPPNSGPSQKRATGGPRPSRD
jgi:chorismate synthase